ncbi:hypothetical protein AWM68_12890 [Fictibacillus phosphorivorans]|uniref:DUF1850 domain-containing protein n=1 Tax=Fictibacillus phosphorivorans TaxID=1221500 RepID=A0A163PRB0_9BACL|nr:DUF1850 domain-containing protein [Fictibacillus phosphorivorans]KZE64001.1 hypothetical protein AWM68_12890 [Fictibacillus phosphorivorans]
MLFLCTLILVIPKNVVKITMPDRTIYEQGSSFAVKWIHSVEKEEWIEMYHRQDGDLTLYKTYFKTFGAGVPSQGKVIKSDKPGYVAFEMNRKMKNILLVVSKNVHSSVAVNKQELPLYRMVPSYEEVKIESIRIPAVFYYANKIWLKMR